MTVIVVCPVCTRDAEYLNGSNEVFVVRLRCAGGCSPVPEEDLDDPDAMSHLASIREGE